MSGEIGRLETYTIKVEENVKRALRLLSRRRRVADALGLELPKAEIDGDGPLTCCILAESEREANRLWLHELLGLGSDPGKWYASDDFSAIKLMLRPCGNDAAVELAGPADVADFDVYDLLAEELGGTIAKASGHGDGEFVEYSIGSAHGVARYCALEFYSNHNWNKDPANLFTVRFSAEVLGGPVGPEDVRLAHPAKATRRRGGGRYLVDSLVMENDIEPKFTTVRYLEDGTRESSSNTKVSADRAMDNPIDFVTWAFMHQQEIALL